MVSYTGQSDPHIDEATPALEQLRRRQEAESSASLPNSPTAAPHSLPSQPASLLPSRPLSPAHHSTTDPLDAIAGTTSLARPATGGKAFPFKLGTHLDAEGRNASMVTLTSQMAVGMPTPGVEDGGTQLGEEGKSGGKRPELESFETAKDGFM
ncbi:MAG: hypothetical protein Q9211_005835 [Gyalolechia sp. 1 TL-2023]